ncbi:MAG: 50S ribosomal protein L10 [Candidatus Omnitrophica bacterium]|nr:50S ribosomal protein L10 [Candidatus Omnitrophota bacterium]
MESTVKYSKACKDLMLKDLEEKFKTNQSFIITEYGATQSNDINSFRRKVEKANFSYMVVKNRLCKNVLQKLNHTDMFEYIGSKCGIAFLGDDVVENTKVVIDFSKDKEPFNIKVGCIEGKLVGIDRLKEIAALPSKKVLISMLLSTLQAPITGFVSVLGGVTRKFVYAIQSIKEKREKE